MNIQEIEDFLSMLILDIDNSYYDTQYKEHCGARYLDASSKFERFQIADICFVIENNRILYFPESMLTEIWESEISDYRIDCLLCCLLIDNRDMYTWLCALRALEKMYKNYSKETIKKIICVKLT